MLEPDSPLRERANLDVASLRRHLPAGPAAIYAYVVRTVEHVDGALVHYGSGPNIEGGWITLCTCKHHMRTYPALVPGTWIAGFAGSRQASERRPAQRNTLFYLTRVEHVFRSFMELWRSPVLPAATQRRKSARYNRLGDLVEPRADAVDEFAIESYHPPRTDHSHGGDEQWHKDVQYQNRAGLHPVMVVGDPQRSFVWTEPRIDRREPLGRGEVTYDSLDELLDDLEPAG